MPPRGLLSPDGPDCRAAGLPGVGRKNEGAAPGTQRRAAAWHMCVALASAADSCTCTCTRMNELACALCRWPLTASAVCRWRLWTPCASTRRRRSRWGLGGPKTVGRACRIGEAAAGLPRSSSGAFAGCMEAACPQMMGPACTLLPFPAFVGTRAALRSCRPVPPTVWD